MAMLKEFFNFTKIEEEDIGNIWFQQDGATCHTAAATLDILRLVFEDHIISRRADNVWPPRSYDLTPLDYYFWGAVKDKCYADKPETIDDLKDNIHEGIAKYSCTQSIKCLNRSCRLLHGQPRQTFERNHFPLLTGRIVLSYKKGNLGKAFSKKKIFGGP